MNTQEAAAKICTKSCMANYPTCGRWKEDTSVFRKMPTIGVGVVCPIAKYKVPDQPESESLVDRMRNNPTLEDCYVLCTDCEHGKIVKDEDGNEFVDRSADFEGYCLDCPVHMVEEYLLEGAAEARMS